MTDAGYPLKVGGGGNGWRRESETMMRMILSKSLFLFVLLLLPLSSVLSAQGEVVDKIVALVNDSVITQSELAEAQQQFSGGSKQEVLNRLIVDRLFEQELKKQNIEVSDVEVDRALESMTRQDKASADAMKAKLAREGLPPSAQKSEIRESLKRDEFLKRIIYPRIRIADYDLDEYYRKHTSLFQGYAKIRFMEILLTTDSAPAGTDLKVLANDVVTQLRSGAPFGEMVKKYSRGAFANQGGDSGLVDTAQMRPDLLNLLSSLPANKVSDPIGTQGGVFIFKVTDRQNPQPRPFNDVKEWVRQQVIQERIDEELERYLMEVRARSFVEIRGS